jgi:hypothetical protein
MSKKYLLPDFLWNRITQEQYLNCFEAKANHIRRARKRGKASSTRSEYKMEIQRAVEHCQGRDSYTDECVDAQAPAQAIGEPARNLARS